jgi:hypothetical protein
MKNKQQVTLADSTGLAWVNAELSPSRAAALVKSYARAGVELQLIGGK